MLDRNMGIIFLGTLLSDLFRDVVLPDSSDRQQEYDRG